MIGIRKCNNCDWYREEKHKVFGRNKPAYCALYFLNPYDPELSEESKEMVQNCKDYEPVRYTHTFLREFCR